MKNYLIIGGSSGIGKELSEILVEEGNKVIATYNTKSMSSPNAQISYHQFDVTQDISELNFIPETLDGLVYCPGNIQLKPFAKIKPQEFIQDFELQVLGAIKTIQLALPALQKAPQASIILFSTVAVQTGFNFHSLVSCSKGAIEGLCKALAAEFAPNIRVNCIAPSLTDTPLAKRILRTDLQKESQAKNHPLKRIGQAIDLAHAAHFLLTEKSSWVSGQILHIDGGLSSIRT